MRSLLSAAILCLTQILAYGEDLTPPAKPLTEQVEDAVKPAKDEFLKSKAAAIDRYKKALDVELEKATSRGSLEDVKAIKKEQEELKADEAEWKIAAVKTAIKNYTTNLDAAKKKYITALDAIVKAQVQKKNIDLAEKVNELKEKGVEDLKDDKASQSGWINIIPYINTSLDSTRGKWEIKDGLLYSDPSAYSILEIPYQPPDEYDYSIKFTLNRSSGKMWTMVGQHIWYKNTPFSWAMDEKGRYYGFEHIDHKDPTNNGYGVKNSVEIGRMYTSTIEIRHGGVKAFVDSKLVSQFSEYNRFSIIGVWGIKDNRALGIRTDASTTFHDICVREVTGKGKFTRGEPKAQSNNAQGKESISGTDQIVGEWKWWTGGKMVANDDGTVKQIKGDSAIHTGTWKCIDRSSRQYNIIWDKDKSMPDGTVDSFIINETGDSIAGLSNKRLSGTKINNK